MLHDVNDKKHFLKHVCSSSDWSCISLIKTRTILTGSFCQVSADLLPVAPPRPLPLCVSFVPAPLIKPPLFRSAVSSSVVRLVNQVITAAVARLCQELMK